LVKEETKYHISSHQDTYIAGLMFYIIGKLNIEEVVDVSLAGLTLSYICPWAKTAPGFPLPYK
jgi:hypothetical protein